MRFQYSAEPTLREAITQSIGYASVCWTDVTNAGVFDSCRASDAADSTIKEVQDLITFSLSRLLDRKGEAKEWNEAIEQALLVVERMT